MDADLPTAWPVHDGSGPGWHHRQLPSAACDRAERLRCNGARSRQCAAPTSTSSELGETARTALTAISVICCGLAYQCGLPARGARRLRSVRVVFRYRQRGNDKRRASGRSDLPSGDVGLHSRCCGLRRDQVTTASALTLTLHVQRKHHKLIVVGRCLGRCPRWHSWARLPPVDVVSRECPERAHAYNESGSGPERIPAFPFVSPPEHHGRSDVKPECT